MHAVINNAATNWFDALYCTSVEIFVDKLSIKPLLDCNLIFMCASDTADFALLEMQVVIPSTTVQGQGVCVAAIVILGDDIVEENETLLVMIRPTNPLDMVSTGRGTTTVTIVDDDGKH